MSDIFISYKREEHPVARKLADALQNKGWSVWWDPKLRAGEHFDDVIEIALNKVKCVIVMWSKLSVKSRYVKDEASFALKRNKLVPIKIEEVDLPFRFEGIQTGQLIDWDGSDTYSEFQKLVDDIEQIIGELPVRAEMGRRKQGLENRLTEKTNNDDLISLYDVSRIFDRSIDAIRKYRSLGLIEPFKRVGRKDLYKKNDIKYAKYFIDTKKRDGKSLQEIAKAFQAQAEKFNDEKPKKLLIIEDNDLMSSAMQRWLRKFFPEDELVVYFAEDGFSGIKFSEKILPDLIVLGVILPVLSGIEVYEKLKKHPRLSHSKFIIMSGNVKFKPLEAVFL